MSKRARVLVVEDDDAVRTTIADLIHLEGAYDVRTVSGGDAALAELERVGGRPHVVVLDLVLPGTTGGLDVLRRRLARGAPAVPVIAMSAQHNLLDAAIELGADVAIGKPFHLDQLLGPLEELARRRISSNPPGDHDAPR